MTKEELTKILATWIEMLNDGEYSYSVEYIISKMIEVYYASEIDEIIKG